MPSTLRLKLRHHDHMPAAAAAARGRSCLRADQPLVPLCSTPRTRQCSSATPVRRAPSRTCSSAGSSTYRVRRRAVPGTVSDSTSSSPAARTTSAATARSRLCLGRADIASAAPAPGDTILRVYVDGEATPAIESTIYQLHGFVFFCTPGDANATSTTGGASRRRDCHFADIPSPSLLKCLLKEEEGAAK